MFDNMPPPPPPPPPRKPAKGSSPAHQISRPRPAIKPYTSIWVRRWLIENGYTVGDRGSLTYGSWLDYFRHGPSPAELVEWAKRIDIEIPDDKSPEQRTAILAYGAWKNRISPSASE